MQFKFKRLAIVLVTKPMARSMNVRCAVPGASIWVSSGVEPIRGGPVR